MSAIGQTPPGGPSRLLLGLTRWLVVWTPDVGRRATPTQTNATLVDFNGKRSGPFGDLDDVQTALAERFKLDTWPVIHAIVQMDEPPMVVVNDEEVEVAELEL